MQNNPLGKKENP